MRELNECTEEVFRRSEKRIRERRRKRNYAFGLCIPICLIVAVWSVTIFSGMVPILDTSDYAQVDREMAGDAEWSLVCPYTAVEIQETGTFPEEHYEQVTDRLAVAEMFRAVRSLFADADGNGKDNDKDSDRDGLQAEDAMNYALTESANIWVSYRITFTAEDGSRAVYNLTENIFLNVNTNETIFLSDAQIAELMAVLGISE